ncbi:hypothetical protein STIUS_v1c06740 [Spiroplasma sp. TIUS-1]|uniref:hypothetical protein n=1 Tax=Spiroplasma sp. TIUS-1 TaxID=216963 RepID=UPI00139772ED|nr:hypothetical protein [Spiroplasma sp. TIUS-1]QHX36228.1 hypothetical protein STIUS_v1c06740 [Spiroplasma sp. TIUS-1]
MKKIISLLCVSAIVISTPLTLISCNFNVDRYSKIYVITDGGKLQDRAFNQSGFLGGNKFINKALGKSEEINVSYAQPTTLTDVPWMYSQAFKHGSKALILPGFKHANFIDKANEAAKKNDGSIVFIDGASSGLNNTIGLSYRSDISGLWSGIASIMYLLKTGKPPVLATFGGIPHAFAVDSFMVGFLASVAVYNEMLKDKSEDSNIMKIAKKFDLKSENMIEAKINNAQADGYSSSKHGQWFTDSFDPGKGSDLSETLLIKNGANIIMPVAGPQTADTLKVLEENKFSGNKFIVGVDTNQVEMYDTYSQYFITSAEKDIVGSSALALAHSNVFLSEMIETKDSFGIDQDKYNEIIDDMGNNLSVTTKTDEGYKNVFTGIDDGLITQQEDFLYKNDWRGMDLWLGGSISKDGNNKINLSQLEVIKDVFKSASLEASKNYFDYVSIPGNGVPSKTLSKIRITEYSNKVLEILNLEKKL